MATRRRMPAAQRRQQLLDMALVMASEQGFVAVTFKALAAKANITRTVLYHQFGSPDGLIEALIERETQRVLGQLERIEVSKGVEFDVAVTEFAVAAVAMVDAAPHTWRVALNPPVQSSPRIIEYVELGRQHARDAVRRLFDEHLNANIEDGEVELRARLALAMGEELLRVYLKTPALCPPHRVVGIVQRVGHALLADDCGVMMMSIPKNSNA